MVVTQTRSNLILILFSSLMTLFCYYIIINVFIYEDRRDTLLLVSCVLSIIVAVMAITSELMDSKTLLKVALFATVAIILLWTVIIIVHIVGEKYIFLIKSFFIKIFNFL